MISNNYAVTQISGGKSDIRCTNSQFGDPLPGVQKGCFCDDVKKLSNEKIIADQLYWANQA
jgi:hypothetical protein